MKRFSQLTQTATEADLVAGNFLAIDVPGVGGATKKLPVNLILANFDVVSRQKNIYGDFYKGVYDWFSIGTINQADGKNMSSDTRIRSDYIRANAGNKIFYKKNKVFLYLYDLQTGFVSFVTLSASNYYYEFSSDCYVRFVLAYSDDAAITDGNKKALLDNIDVKTDIKNPILSIPGCEDFEIWEPSNIPDRFKTTLDWATCTCPIGYDTLLKTFFDVWLCHNNEYKVNKRSLGFDASNKFQLFEYDFIPKNYSRVVLLSAGMNGVETSTIFGIAYFLRSLFTETDDGLVWLRENVRFKIIPVINPYSFEMCSPGYGATGISKYVNANGVNINRNFDYAGQWSRISPSVEGQWSYKGAAPESEPETKILINWIRENATTALCWMDCHSDVTGSGTDTFRVYTSDPDTRNRIIAAQTKIKTFYTTAGLSPSNPSASVVTEGTTYPKHPYFYEYMGVRSFMMEQYFNVGTGYGATGYNCDAASIKNYVVSIRAYVLEMCKGEEIVFEKDDIFNLLRCVKTKEIGSKFNSNSFFFSYYNIKSTGALELDYSCACTDFIAAGINGNIRVACDSSLYVWRVVEYDADYQLVNYREVGSNRATSFTSTGKYIRVVFKSASGNNLNLNAVTPKNIMIATDYVSRLHSVEYGRFINISPTSAKIDRVYTRCLSQKIPLTKDLKQIKIKRLNTKFVPVDFASFRNDNSAVGGALGNVYDSETDTWLVSFGVGTEYMRFSIKLSDDSNSPINLFELEDAFNVEPL